jgi:NADPH:quinone reductase-like Zn-dependent oxidoreductase
MKAIRYTRYGSPDVLQLKEVEQPVPKDTEVLIKVHASSVNAYDWHLMTGKPFLVRTSAGLRKPKDPRFGVDLSGQVEAVGSAVTRFHPGDAVFGRGDGAFAEYACAREQRLVAKPAALTFEAAAAVPIAALTALKGVRDSGQVRPGQQVLIQGASGGVGTFAVQIAKALGAAVTAVCSTGNVEMARSLGADEVIDYTKENWTRNRKMRKRYDLILAVNGYHPIWAYRRALRPTGRFVMIGAANARLNRALFQAMLLGPALSRKGGRKLSGMMSTPDQQDLLYVKELLETGKVVPVIERRYPLAETVEAMRYFDSGHVKAKIVITV